MILDTSNQIMLLVEKRYAITFFKIFAWRTIKAKKKILIL